MAPWLSEVADALRSDMSLLDPQLPKLLALGLLGRASSMSERDFVEAFNKCQTMAGKAKVLDTKGLAKDRDPVADMRSFLAATLLGESPTQGDDDEAQDDDEGE